MSILSWFKKAARGEDTGSVAAAPAMGEEGESAEVAGLNFMTAIDAHMRWKSRLESYIQGASNEAIDMDAICRDDACPLGKWIYSVGGERFGNTEAFVEMKAQHASFHRCACKVLEEAHAGHQDVALRMLQHGDYVRASERVKMMLAKLYVQIAG